MVKFESGLRQRVVPRVGASGGVGLQRKIGANELMAGDGVSLVARLTLPGAAPTARAGRSGHPLIVATVTALAEAARAL